MIRKLACPYCFDNDWYWFSPSTADTDEATREYVEHLTVHDPEPGSGECIILKRPITVEFADE